MNTDLIVSRLRELRSRIDDREKQGISARDTPEFKVWKSNVEKWLDMDRLATGREHTRFEGLYFRVLRVGANGFGYDSEDRKKYTTDLVMARSYIDSAVENLELGLKTEQPRRQPAASRPDINIHMTQTQTLSNTTVLGVFESVKRHVEELPDSPEKKSSLQKLSEITANPLFNTIAGTVLAALIKGS